MGWYEVHGSVEPQIIDTTLSKKWNYIRKEITFIPAMKDKDAEWIWKEQKIRKEDWLLYQQLLSHDDALDDVYAALTELAEIVAG